MQCPYCKSDDQSNIIRTLRFPLYIRRRRECLKCGKRFWTLEEVVIDDE